MVTLAACQALKGDFLSEDNFTQREFAEVFSRYLEESGIKQVFLARELGKNRTTISRWKRPNYKNGPPEASLRREIEVVLRLPSGVLDEAAETLHKRRKDGPGDAKGVHPDIPVSPESGSPTDDSTVLRLVARLLADGATEDAETVLRLVIREDDYGSEEV